MIGDGGRDNEQRPQAQSGHGQAGGRHRQQMTMSTRPGLAGEADPLVDTQPAASDSPPAPGMVWVPGGTFLMGSDHHYPEEAPAHG